MPAGSGAGALAAMKVLQRWFSLGCGDDDDDDQIPEVRNAV